MQKMSVFLVVLLALCIVLPASAQVNLGVLGGLNLANASMDPLEEGTNLSSRTAFGFGAILDFGLNESITLHLEPMYLQKGFKLKVDMVDMGEIAEWEVKFAYLEIPVMLKYAFGTSEIKPYIIAGPTIAYNLSSKLKISMGGVSEEGDVKDDIKSLDFGVGFGAGVNVAMGNNSIFVEARYALGLTNINDHPNDPDIKTKGIQIFAGITFPVGGE